MFRKIYLYPILVVCAITACKKSSTEEIVDKSSEVSKLSYKALNTTIDSLQYHNPLQLDLNNDQQIDFILTSLLLEENDRPYLYLVVNRKSPQLNKIMVNISTELVNNGYWAVPFDKDANISQEEGTQNKWNTDLSKGYLIRVSDNGINKTFAGEWIGKKDKYLGLKFLIGNVYHYGWLRISHTEGEEKLAIIDYAYNREAGKAIKAGQK